MSIQIRCSSLGFPIVPPRRASGTYNGNEYFLIEKVNRSLSAVISDESFVVSKDDLLNLASQILEILYILFSNDLVLKNLHINDFMLRRTTRGFRAVLINQDFYTKYDLSKSSFIDQNQLHNRRFHVYFTQCNGWERYCFSFIL